jgi:hypothetical protein
MKIKNLINTNIYKRITFATLLIFSGCSYLSSNPNSESYAPEYKEHLVYTIDNHRYITIYGTNHCMGTIYYYDTALNIRKSVSVTGETLGTGIFQGYYAVDSKYIAIPSIIFSEMSGPRLYIYYSYDQGRNFNLFSVGGYSKEWGILVKNENLYLMSAKNVEKPIKDFDGYLSYLTVISKYYETMNISRIEKFDISRNVLSPGDFPGDTLYGAYVLRKDLPSGIRSASGETHFICGPIIDKN